MGKAENYMEILKNKKDWDTFLLDESGLPGPRGNLELVDAVAQAGDIDRFRRYLAYDADSAPYGSSLEFLPVCGAVGLGRLIAEGQTDLLDTLRPYASDPRWRVREGVAIGLQKFGDKDIDGLLLAMEVWVRGNLLERRAVAAAICEPRLLKKKENAKRALHLLDKITEDLTHEQNRRQEDFKVLRKSLAYCWSVAAAADPQDGRILMEKWFLIHDSDVLWIMKENLKKNRLRRLDPSWAVRWEDKMAARVSEHQ